MTEFPHESSRHSGGSCAGVYLPVGGRQQACERFGRRALASDLPTEAEAHHRRSGNAPVTRVEVDDGSPEPGQEGDEVATVLHADERAGERRGRGDAGIAERGQPERDGGPGGEADLYAKGLAE